MEWSSVVICDCLLDISVVRSNMTKSNFSLISTNVCIYFLIWVEGKYILLIQAKNKQTKYMKLPLSLSFTTLTQILRNNLDSLLGKLTEPNLNAPLSTMAAFLF